MTSPASLARLEVGRAGREPFLPAERMAELEETLVNSNHRRGAARRLLSSHLPTVCPRCEVSGYYRWHFLGRFSHPACGYRWAVNPCRYLARQVGWGATSAAKLSFDPANAGQGGLGESVLGGCMLGLFRVPVATLLLPIQSVIWLMSTRADPK